MDDDDNFNLDPSIQLPPGMSRRQFTGLLLQYRRRRMFVYQQQMMATQEEQERTMRKRWRDEEVEQKQEKEMMMMMAPFTKRQRLVAAAAAAAAAAAVLTSDRGPRGEYFKPSQEEREQGFYERFARGMMPPIQFKQSLRLTPRRFDSLVRTLYGEGGYSQGDSKARADRMPNAKRVMITLYILAQGVPLSVVKDVFRVSRGKASEVFQEVTFVISSKCKEWVYWPKPEERPAISAAFHEGGDGSLAYPPAIGALDGVLLPFWRRPSNLTDDDGVSLDANRFYNPKLGKGRCGINLLAMCDHQLLFRFFMSGPARDNDKALLQRTRLGRAMRDNDEEVLKEYFGDDLQDVIMSDAGFELHQNNMVPYPTRQSLADAQLTPRQILERVEFNHRLAPKRQVIERAFGHMVTRWPYIKNMRCEYAITKNVVASVLVLHNICELQVLEDNEEQLAEDDLDLDLAHNSDDSQPGDGDRDDDGDDDMRVAVLPLLSQGAANERRDKLAEELYRHNDEVRRQRRRRRRHNRA